VDQNQYNGKIVTAIKLLHDHNWCTR